MPHVIKLNVEPLSAFRPLISLLCASTSRSVMPLGQEVASLLGLSYRSYLQYKNLPLSLAT